MANGMKKLTTAAALVMGGMGAAQGAGNTPTLDPAKEVQISVADKVTPTGEQGRPAVLLTTQVRGKETSYTSVDCDSSSAVPQILKTKAGADMFNGLVRSGVEGTYGPAIGARNTAALTMHMVKEGASAFSQAEKVCKDAGLPTTSEKMDKAVQFYQSLDR